MTAIVIISAILIVLLGGIPLIKKRMWKELLCAAFLLTMSLFFQIGKNLGIPGPIDLIENLFKPIGKTFLNRL
jgi:Na+-translocating ferredoxin:NAD+ oxidoreductase RnfD subunit